MVTTVSMGGMMERMRECILFVAGALVAGCAIEEPKTSSVDQLGTSMQGTSMQGTSMQGTSMQGTSMQGTSMQGTSMQGFQLGGVTISGSQLQNVRVEKGELVGQRGANTLRGTALVGAHL